MKKFAIFAMLVSCAPLEGGLPTTWEAEANGHCRDIQVNVPSGRVAHCPNARHAEPAELGRSADGKTIAYICYCL